MNKNLAYVYIMIATFFWGIIGVFVTYLYEIGFTPTQVVSVRALSASLFLIVYVLYKNRSLLIIKLTDAKYFVGTGIVSIVFFNLCLFHAIQETSISIAAILLYTAPAFVTLFSKLFFKEALTTRKMIALFVTLLGCTLVIGIFPHTTEGISLYGLILGLGSGLFYALYSVFGKMALRKLDSLTITVYTFVFAAIAITPFSEVWKVFPLLLNGEVWLYIGGLGFFSTTLAFIFYTKGLQMLESSRASIMATLEPVIAAFMSFLLFGETLTFWQYGGVVLVITAVILVQEPPRKGRKSSSLSA
ncbi:DMT family transporter [Ammoniphilus sp. YIM 78166]|uniref:DMT family transporter n=1 Tax=Ammoniphilus sp. YIM 78166 TaxID=1644106 RepID=UPI00106F7F31|nr:EamA family transporter [Ammoniphilus sp. YIM 78166]